MEIEVPKGLFARRASLEREQEEDEDHVLKDRFAMVQLRESRESNQRLSEKVAQLEAQIEEVATERSRKR